MPSIFIQKHAQKNRNYSLGFSVHISCDFLLHFSVRFEEIALFLAENCVTLFGQELDLKHVHTPFCFTPYFICKTL
jgi:hypothetical protein